MKSSFFFCFQWPNERGCKRERATQGLFQRQIRLHVIFVSHALLQYKLYVTSFWSANIKGEPGKEFLWLLEDAALGKLEKQRTLSRCYWNYEITICLFSKYSLKPKYMPQELRAQRRIRMLPVLGKEYRNEKLCN